MKRNQSSNAQHRKTGSSGIASGLQPGGTKPLDKTGVTVGSEETGGGSTEGRATGSAKTDDQTRRHPAGIDKQALPSERRTSCPDEEASMHSPAIRARAGRETPPRRLPANSRSGSTAKAGRSPSEFHLGRAIGVQLMLPLRPGHAWRVAPHARPRSSITCTGRKSWKSRLRFNN